MMSPTPPVNNENMKSILSSECLSISRPASIAEIASKRHFPSVIEEEESIRTISRPGSSVAGTQQIKQIELKKLGSQGCGVEMDNLTNNILSYESANETDKDVENEISQSDNMVQLRDAPSSRHSSVNHTQRSFNSKTDDCNQAKTTDAVFTNEEKPPQQFQFFESHDMGGLEKAEDDENYVKL